jgi:hypothetical protein
MTKVNLRSVTYPVSVHEATTGKELGATELSGQEFQDAGVGRAATSQIDLIKRWCGR